MTRISNIRNKISSHLIDKILTKGVHYHVDNITITNSSHELAQNNPILKKLWVKGSTNNTFQHPTIGRITCDKPGCENKICDKPCSTVQEKAYVGHATHSAKYGKYISDTDFNNKNSTQYYLAYKSPIKNHDSQGQNTDNSRTENLNQQNKDARTLIHIYSSHNPLEDTI